MEADRVFAEPASQFRAVSSCAVVVQASVFVLVAGGVGEAVVDGGSGFIEDLAEGGVGAVVDNGRVARGAVVGGQVAHGAQVVGQRPEHVAGSGQRIDLLVGQDLVDRRAVQVAVGQVAVAVEDQRQMVPRVAPLPTLPVVDMESVRGQWAVVSGVEGDAHQAIEPIVIVQNVLGHWR